MADEFGLPEEREPAEIPRQGEIEAFTKKEKQRAVVRSNQIDDLLEKIQKNESALAHNYARLGILLNEVRAEKYWILWGYRTFGQYMSDLGKRIAKGRTQLYQMISVTEKLLPQVSEDELTRMGITKALELKRVLVQKPGQRISPEIIETAVNPEVTVEELRGEIFKEHNVKGEYAGIYRDLGGFYATSDEWKEIQRAFDIAIRTDPVIPQDIPEWARKKEILLRLSREYLATYEAAVEQGEA